MSLQECGTYCSAKHSTSSPHRMRIIPEFESEGTLCTPSDTAQGGHPLVAGHHGDANKVHLGSGNTLVMRLQLYKMAEFNYTVPAPYETVWADSDVIQMADPRAHGLVFKVHAMLPSTASLRDVDTYFRSWDEARKSIGEVDMGTLPAAFTPSLRL